MDEGKGKNNKKFLIIAIIAVVALLAAGGALITSNKGKTDNKTEPSAEVSDSMKEAQSNLNKSQKAFDTAKKAYDGLSDSATKEERQKAYDALKSAYDNLTVAQGTMKQRVSNSAEVKKLDADKASNEQIVLDAKKKLDAASNDASKKKEEAKAEQKADKKDSKPAEKATVKVEQKSTPKPTAKANNKPAANQNKATVNQPAPKKKSCRTVNHPAQTHQETAYKNVHHDEVSHMENYVVTPASDEQVVAGAVYVCNDCGQKFNTVGELEDHADIVHDNAANYHTEPIYKTVHHDAVMGQRKVVDRPAYDERVATGTYTVTDKEAWSEQVCN